MRRFFCEQDMMEGSTVILQEEQHKHLMAVLRAKLGDQVVLCNGDGFDYSGVVHTICKQCSEILITQKEPNAAEPQVKIDLYFGLTKVSDKQDLIVQKAVELGANAVIPFVSRFCVAKSANVYRLQKIANEALKQCGRAKKVDIRQVASFAGLKESLANYEQVVWAYEKADADARLHLDKHTKSVAIVVGSEGGFCDTEANDLRSLGVTPISLGKRILRAETASIVLMGLVGSQLEI
ncbi:MAG: 16S rRNA (uracil(1498)-N(3))-methyltransferase [Firmicutes bacterium]|nr:16S rRNA (uracil(1498)-N(3))-methyltransferase [Bacillota bacterium]